MKSSTSPGLARRPNRPESDWLRNARASSGLVKSTFLFVDVVTFGRLVPCAYLPLPPNMLSTSNGLMFTPACVLSTEVFTNWSQRSFASK